MDKERNSELAAASEGPASIGPGTDCTCRSMKEALNAFLKRKGMGSRRWLTYAQKVQAREARLAGEEADAEGG